MYFLFSFGFDEFEHKSFLAETKTTCLLCTMGACVSSKHMNDSAKTCVHRPNTEPLSSHSLNIKKHVLINGYCRKLQCHEIIPIEIINLCALFYGVYYTKNLFMVKNGHISILNMNSMETYDIRHHNIPSNKVQSNVPFCFIPNINPQKGLDGIICSKAEQHYCFWDHQGLPHYPLLHAPTLLLFDRTKYDENNVIKYCKITMLHGSPVQQFLFCDQNGIICIKSDGCLYRLRLPSNIEFIDDPLSNLKFTQHIDQTFWLKNDKLVICYLQDRQQIFGINQRSNARKICAIFSFKGRYLKGQWKCIKTEKLKIEHECKLCYDGKGNVYIVSVRGKVCRYNLDSNQWNIWLKNGLINDERFMMDWHQVWIEKHDNDKIYCSNGKCIMYFDVIQADLGNASWTILTRFGKVFDTDKKSVIFVS